MTKTRFTEEQMIGVLQGAVAGRPIRELCRHHGITETTFFPWRQKYGSMQVSEARRLKALEEENRRLTRLMADLSLDTAMLNDVVGRKW